MSVRARQLLLIAVLALLVAPSSAAARWGPAQELGQVPPGASFGYDGNARGDRIAVWNDGGGPLVFARARPGEAFGPARALPDDARHVEEHPRVELDERGNALLVWSYFDFTEEVEERGGQGYRCCNGLRARVIRADDSLTAVRTLAPAGTAVGLADMQIGPGSRVGLVFHIQNGQPVNAMEARFGTVARGLGNREPVASAPVDAPAGLAFVRGRARLTYATGTGFGNDVEPVVFREVERLGYARYRRMPSPGDGELVRSSVRFATAPGGEQVVTWVQGSGQNPFLNQAVLAGTRRPGQAFSVRRLASESAVSRVPAAIEPRGTALVAWASGREPGVATSLRRPPRGFRGPARVSSHGEPITLGTPAVDVNDGGRGLLAWSERPTRGPVRLVGVFRNARGTPLEHQVIESGGGPFSFNQVAASLDREGRGFVAYTNGETLRVTAARIGG